MKIAITGIYHNENHVKGLASVECDCLITPATLCNIPVAVDYVEGKSLEQYHSELEVQAREIISGIYKEIVCDSMPDEDILDLLRGEIAPSALSDELLSKINRITKITGDVMVCGVLNGEGVMVVRAPDISGPVRVNNTRSNHSLEERVTVLEKTWVNRSALTGVSLDIENYCTLRLIFNHAEMIKLNSRA
ncbi:TPA: hypothetical protein H2C15_004797 [Salmonella enterica]|nr:hypothetical protein [Salmonella enterica]